jgi:hypothetical protein
MSINIAIPSSVNVMVTPVAATAVTAPQVSVPTAADLRYLKGMATPPVEAAVEAAITVIAGEAVVDELVITPNGIRKVQRCAFCKLTNAVVLVVAAISTGANTGTIFAICPKRSIGISNSFFLMPQDIAYPGACLK